MRKKSLALLVAVVSVLTTLAAVALVGVAVVRFRPRGHRRRPGSAGGKGTA